MGFDNAKTCCNVIQLSARLGLSHLAKRKRKKREKRRKRGRRGRERKEKERGKRREREKRSGNVTLSENGVFLLFSPYSIQTDVLRHYLSKIKLLQYIESIYIYFKNENSSRAVKKKVEIIPQPPPSSLPILP